MRRNSDFLFLDTGYEKIPVPWVDNAPDFSGFSEPTLGVLQQIWQAFLDSGKELEVIPDPEPPPPAPDWTTFNATMLQKPSWQSWTALLPLQLVMGIVSASTLEHIEEVQSGLAIAYQISDPGPDFKSEWQAIADANHVPIIF